MTAKIERNTPVEIIVNAKTLPTRVVRHMRKEIYLDALSETDWENTPRIGQKAILRWVDGNIVYEQPVRVSNVLAIHPMVVVEILDHPVCTERRGAARMPVSIPLEYRRMREDSEWRVTTTLNLSEDGVLFPSAIQPWQGLHLQLRLHLRQEEMTIVGEVKRASVSPQDVRGRKAWLTAVHFLNITTSYRQIMRNFLQNKSSRRMRTAQQSSALKEDSICRYQ
ncbi:MAG: PilZ domain-containing protein [Firmicutes bacterium]|nr:PilZ domain-containing protein [Bacillota bacterium]